MQADPSRRRPRVVSTLAGMALALALGSPASAQTCSSTIGSNFNGTSIAASNFVWFNAIVTVKGRDTGSDTTLRFDASQLSFASGATSYTLDVPASRIEFSTATTVSETFYDSGSDTWVTRLPSSYTGNAFLSGLALQVPAPGLPGGINPVNWSGRFRSSAAGLKAQWKWAAAVYTSFSTDLGALGVKPVDDKSGVYLNSDHAGTPENFRSYVIGGARGGGGSNYTGSYSGTAAVVPCVATRDLSVSKNFAPETQFLNRPGDFYVQVTNNGPDAAGAVVIQDTLSPLLQAPTAALETGNGSCTVSGQSVTCSVASLAVGETAVVHVRYLLPAGSQSGSLLNCATATDSDGNSAQGCATLNYRPGGPV